MHGSRSEQRDPCHVKAREQGRPCHQPYPAEDPAEPDWDDAETPGWFALTDVQFSVVALLTPEGRIVERVVYDPYGRGRHHYAADYDGNGAVEVPDLNGTYGHLTAWFADDMQADWDRNGTTYGDTPDIFAFQTDWFAQTGSAGAMGGAGQISRRYAAGSGINANAPDNMIGYCGYVFNPETDDYTVRFRHYDPEIGRWLQRDLLDYVDGSNMFLGMASSPTMFVDPLGLAADDPLESMHPYPLYLGGDPNQTCVLAPRSDHRCGTESQHAYIREALGGGDNDSQRKAWKKLSRAQREKILEDSLKKIGVDEKTIKANMSDFTKNAKPGENCSPDRKKRKRSAKVIDRAGKPITGAVAVVGYYLSVREAGAAIKEFNDCSYMRQKIEKFEKDPTNCDILKSARGYADSCFLAIGEALGDNLGGFSAVEALREWDELVDKCEEAQNQARCCKKSKE